MLRFSTLGPWVVETPAGSSKFWQQAEEQEAGLQEDQGFYLAGGSQSPLKIAPTKQKGGRTHPMKTSPFP